jgi:hypothetical protein
VARAGLDAVALPHSDWSGGMVALMHRFEMEALGTDAQFPRIIDALLNAGIDGIYSDHVDDLMGAIGGL